MDLEKTKIQEKTFRAKIILGFPPLVGRYLCLCGLAIRVGVKKVEMPVL